MTKPPPRFYRQAAPSHPPAPSPLSSWSYQNPPPPDAQEDPGVPKLSRTTAAAAAAAPPPPPTTTTTETTTRTRTRTRLARTVPHPCLPALFRRTGTRGTILTTVSVALALGLVALSNFLLDTREDNLNAPLVGRQEGRQSDLVAVANDSSSSASAKNRWSWLWGKGHDKTEEGAHARKKHHAVADSSDMTTTTAPGKKDDAIPMPHGVNLGSWLSLEDYFFVGETGAVEVATPYHHASGVCLPPLHAGQLLTVDGGVPALWQSETDLLTTMLQVTTTAKALKVFHAHRASFITDYDLKRLAAPPLKIKHVRVPLSWCFTDHDPDVEIKSLDADDKATQARLLEAFTCPDPFFPGLRWPAIPRIMLERFLRSCAKYGISASLDLHTYPGGTSPGTFSGVWPRQPRFWQHDDPVSSFNPQNATTPSVDFGRQLYRDFVYWIEKLDKGALKGVLGISPMNEPAHLAGVYSQIPGLDFLPPLPHDLEESYLQMLNHDSVYQMPAGPHLRVLRWISDAVQVFRASKLPGLGKQLHVNLHESVLRESVVKKTYTHSEGENSDEEAKSSMASMTLVAAWWNKTTTTEERQDWALLDVHHYHAWSKSCSGTMDGPPTGNYSCANVEARDAALERCARWVPHTFRSAVDDMCGPGAKLMSGEFSASTHHKVRRACNDVDTLRVSYLTQMQAAKKAKVRMYYWSFKMPFGGAFRSAWSFTELMYLLGVTDRPDHENLSCGEHVPRAGEVTDDIFQP